MKSLVPSPSYRMMDTAPSVATWSWKDDMQAAAMNRSRHRVVESYHKTRIKFELQPFSLEKKKFFLPFNPPRFKDGKEEKMPMPYLAVTAGPLEFKVTRNMEPGNVIRRSHEIRRRCGEDAAKRFTEEALAFLAERPRADKPERKPMQNPFHVEASGVCNRFRKGRIQSEIGSPMFEYKDSEKAAESIHSSATLRDAFKSAALVRRALNPSPRRRKAA